MQGLSKFTQKRMQKKSIPKKKSSLSGRSWTIRKDYKSPVHRVRFEPLRRRTASVKLLKDDPIFLKVPSYKDIETIFSRKDSLKEQIKSSCSSDGSTQKSTNKDDPQHQTLFSVRIYFFSKIKACFISWPLTIPFFQIFTAFLDWKY